MSYVTVGQENSTVDRPLLRRPRFGTARRPDRWLPAERPCVGLVIPNCGHHPVEETPDEMLAALTAFLAPYRNAGASAVEGPRVG